MGNIFLKLCNMSIAAGWLILTVILLRVLLKRAPRWIHCLLWGIVAVRLICPFSIESVYSLIPSAETIQSNTIIDGEFYKNVPVIDSRISIINDTVNPVLQEAFDYEEEESAAPMQIYTYLGDIVWSCGLLLLSVYALIGQFRMRHMLKEAVCYRDNIYFCDAVASPFLLGFIRPRIYLPSGMDEAEMSCVVLHEQAHLKRKDHWWKLLGYLLLSVYWFHPLCWAAYIIFCRDIEFACDEKVIKDMTLSEKKEYSRALLSCSCFGRVIMAYPLAFGEVGVKKRIKSVLHYRKSPVWIVTSAVAACMIVAVCFLTNPQTGKGIIEITGMIGNDEHFTGMIGSNEHFGENMAEAMPEETGQSYEKADSLAVARIRITNGNNGEMLFYDREDSDGVFEKLLQLYEQLDENVDTEENVRVGYQYSMILYDEEGNVLHMVTPYKDGFTIDNMFYAYSGSFGYDKASVALMNNIDLLFYPARSMPLDEEAKMEETIGVQIVLPENESWIKDICYYYKSDNTMEIQYYDAILKADCTLYAVKDGILELPDTTFDSNLEENWEGWTSDSQHVLIKVQRSEDGKGVLASWEYGDCAFGIQTTVSDKNVDIGSVPKTAITVIQNF